jgi:hypothetical protein
MFRRFVAPLRGAVDFYANTVGGANTRNPRLQIFHHSVVAGEWLQTFHHSVVVRVKSRTMLARMGGSPVVKMSCLRRL